MNNISPLSTKIDANDVTLSGILDRQKFTIDYFQREYRWEEKHMAQLIDDLTTSFLNCYDVTHDRSEVENYNGYYMGPVVLSNKEGKFSIIDGQQRLTSLTLLLIYLHNRQKGIENPELVDTLIFSEKYGNKTYNMQVSEREKCLDELYNNGTYQPVEEDASVRNLIERYDDIEELFPEEIDNGAIPFFASWIKEKLIFVKIVTYSEENAYTIFETMNDRGLNLTPTEMLKGYLLSKVNLEKKNELNILWKKAISQINEWGETEDQEFFRAWLRAKFADTIRPGKKGASNEDFEKIGTTFHTWVKDTRMRIGLDKEKDFIDFIENKFKFYTNLYVKITEAYNDFNPALNKLSNLYWFGIASSLVDPLLMAPILETDNEEVQNKKIQLISHYLDCFAVYRSVNQRTLGQSSLRYTIYSLVKEVRNKSIDELASMLKKKVLAFEESLDGIMEFNLHQQNKRFVRYFLARLTQYIEDCSGIVSSVEDYMRDDIKKPSEIEHIWADIYNQHKDEFDQKIDFQFYRNCLGGLILLPRGTNQSFNKDAYDKKLPHYIKQNLLAQTLHPDCYNKNPNFTNWYLSANLPFRSYVEFKKSDLESRTVLYKEIAKKIWSPELFDTIAGDN